MIIVRMIIMLFVAMILIGMICTQIFLSRLFGKLNPMKSVSIGDIPMVSGIYLIIFMICLCRQSVVLSGQRKMMGRFKMGMTPLFMKLMVVLANIVGGHILVVLVVFGFWGENWLIVRTFTENHEGEWSGELR